MVPAAWARQPQQPWWPCLQVLELVEGAMELDDYLRHAEINKSGEGRASPVCRCALQRRPSERAGLGMRPVLWCDAWDVTGAVVRC